MTIFQFEMDAVVKERSFQSISHIVPWHLISNFDKDSRLILLKKVYRDSK